MKGSAKGVTRLALNRVELSRLQGFRFRVEGVGGRARGLSDGLVV